MEGTIRGRKGPPGRVIREAVDAARRLEALGHARPIVLAVHPVTQNPFAALLYKRTWDHGIAPIPVFRIDDLDELAGLPGMGIRTVLHLHWTNRVLRGVTTEDAGRAAIASFLAVIDRFIEGGGRLVWTVHNVLPHDTRWPRLDADLQQAIVDRASMVHVLAAATADLVAEWFTLPAERVLHVPMPSYRGVYEDIVSRDEARNRLELDPDALVYGTVGAIKPYKGLEDLLDAFDTLIEGNPRPRRLLVAGAPDAAPETRRLVDRCAAHPFVSIHPRRIDPAEMQLFLRATDVAVLPYEHSLNSGVLLLALTFGLPVVAPATGGMGETVSDAVARTYDPNRTGSLVEALRASDALIADDAARAASRDAALTIAADHDPDALSEAFARGLVERLA